MIRRLLIALLLAGSQPATATTLQDLKANDQLRLRSWLEPEQDISVGQEVKLVIEVSTRRWFAGGTRIRHPEVAGLVILQRDGFATNLSRQEAGDTWVVQQWHLELYPQTASQFQLPALTLELAVNDASAGIVRGQLATEPMGFSASIPPLMQEAPAWLAAPAFSVEQRFDRDLDGLVPGDAFTRTITLRASKLTSMMLPAITEQSIEGLATYPENPSLEDRSNRGEATALRTETITYVVEQPGQYLLPQRSFHWWNTAEQSAQLVTLDAVRIDAGNPGTSPRAQRKLPTGDLHWWLLALIPLLLGTWWLLRRSPHRADPIKLAGRLLRQGQTSAALGQLYSWLNKEKPPPDWLSLRTVAARSSEENGAAVNQLMRAAYSPDAEEETIKLRAGSLRRRQKPGRLGVLLRPIEMRLNPGNNAVSQKESP